MKPATTVVLLRPTKSNDRREAFEVFLVKRAARSGFMGGMYVFPGGKLDPADQTDSAKKLVSQSGYLRWQERIHSSDFSRPAVDEALAKGLLVASVREVFEEAGVLLAKVGSTGQVLQTDVTETKTRFLEWRARLAKGECSFADFLTAEDLYLDPVMLTYFAHWITPSREKRRYDTRFFVAYQPIGQEAVVDDHEAVDGVWRTPKEAISDYRQGDIALAPPTLRILEDLSGHISVSHVIDWAAGRDVWPIMPKVGTVNDQIAILLPWDPGFEATDGESILGLPHPHPNAEGPSRVVLEGQQWHSRNDFAQSSVDD